MEQSIQQPIQPGGQGPEVMPGPFPNPVYPNPPISLWDLEQDYLALEKKLNHIITTQLDVSTNEAEYFKFQAKAMLYIARSLPQQMYPFHLAQPEVQPATKPQQ